MSYCTESDLVNRFGNEELIQLTDIMTPMSGVINATVLALAQSDADAVINDYLVNFLPLPAVPARLVKAACDITRYFLYKDTPTEHVERRYRDAIDYLANIDFDKNGIGADSTGTPVLDTQDSIDINQGRAAFGPHQLRDYVYDDDEPFGLGRMGY